MSEEIENLLEKSKTHREKNSAEGSAYADEAYRKAQHSKNIPLAIAALKERITYAMQHHSNFAEGDKLAAELLEILDIPQNPEEAATTYNIRGVCNDVTGNYLQSRSYYLQTVELLENNNLTNTGKIILGNAYYNIVKQYTQIEVDEDRSIYLEQALRTFQAAENADGLARVWNLKASILPEDAPVQDRLALFEKALSYFEKGTDIKGRIVCMANIGLCYCHLKQFEKGIAILNDAISQIKQTNHSPLIGFTLFQMAEALRLKGDHQAAVNYLHQAEEIMLKANAKVHLNVVYHEWATNLAALGDYHQAYDKLLKYTEQVSHRLSFDRQSAVEEARLKFELEKKEKESELLRKKNEEIEITNKKLNESIAELNQFAYVASHDLKEPLRMINNYMHLLQRSMEGQLNDEQASYIRYASDGAVHMFGLINSLLDFSRAVVDPNLKEVDLNTIVNEVLHIVLSGAEHKVQITRDKLPSLTVDHNQMIQLFQNIISNAIKYNDKEMVQINISYQEKPWAHIISISDNGIGIEPRYRKQIFDIFQRLHHRNEYSGTGIGLAICQKIINNLNGKIWVEDSKTGGTAFVFSIPKEMVLQQQ